MYTKLRNAFRKAVFIVSVYYGLNRNKSVFLSEFGNTLKILVRVFAMTKKYKSS